MEIWVDNGNVVRGLGERLGVEVAGAVWAVAEGWFGNALEEGDNLEAQLGEGSGGGLCHAGIWPPFGEGAEQREVNWARGHANKRTTRRTMSTCKHRGGNVRVGAICTAAKRGVASQLIPQSFPNYQFHGAATPSGMLPRRKSWRLCYDGVEMVRVLGKGLREKVRTERLVGYSRKTRGWGWRLLNRWLRGGARARWVEGGRQSYAPDDSNSEGDALYVADRRYASQQSNQDHKGREGSAVKVCNVWVKGCRQGGPSICCSSQSSAQMTGWWR